MERIYLFNQPGGDGFTLCSNPNVRLGFGWASGWASSDVAKAKKLPLLSLAKPKMPRNSWVDLVKQLYKCHGFLQWMVHIPIIKWSWYLKTWICRFVHGSQRWKPSDRTCYLIRQEYGWIVSIHMKSYNLYIYISNCICCISMFTHCAPWMGTPKCG